MRDAAERRAGIRERLDDAHMLWNSGRKNGAFLMGLVALAGLSRLRYPQGISPTIYFERLRKHHPSQTTRTAKKERERKKKEPLFDTEAFKCIALDLIGDIITRMLRPASIS